MGNGNGYNTSGLRSDARQFLIYDDETLGALMRGLEAWALQIAGRKLRGYRRGGHKLRPVNAMGSLMARVADARITEMVRAGGAQAVVADWLMVVSRYIADGQAVWTPDVDRAFSELHGLVARLDSRATGAGIVGPGVHRVAVRGD